MMITPTTVLIEQNNRAVDIMLRGDYSTATELLKECFNTARQSLFSSDECDNSRQQEEERHDFSSMVVEVESAAISQPPAEQATTTSSPLHHQPSSSSCLLLPANRSPRPHNGGEEDFYIFSRPLYISAEYYYVRNLQHQPQHDQQSLKGGFGSMHLSEVMITAAIITNMALLFHLRAGYHSDRKLLSKAQRIYMSVIGLMRELPASLNAFSIDLSIIAFNNLASVSLELDDLAKADKAIMVLQNLCALRESKHLAQQLSESSTRAGALFLSELNDDRVMHEIATNVLLYHFSSAEENHDPQQEATKKTGATVLSRNRVVLPCAAAA